MNKKKTSNFILPFFVLLFGFWIYGFSQGDDIDFTLDVNSQVIATPEILRPNVDLSGRGWHKENSWPQSLSAQEAINAWGQDIGFGGLFRLQFNLWEINELAKDPPAQGKLLANYEQVIQKINQAGGVVILNIFGTPAGLGTVLDAKSPPLDLKAFKEIVKKYIRDFSCLKKYNIWYEVWSAPDMDDFFLGRKQEYLGIYRAISEGVMELEKEYKIHIPLGGPSSSWWFQGRESNTIATPEKSLIYDLIRYCYHYRLPLDFISWHAYSTDPQAEMELTRYRKNAAGLVRDWLSYFKFKKETPLIIDEWNYDSGENISVGRGSQANICASFIPARLKNMYRAGISRQVYFCLEGFQDNKEQVTRNLGLFWLESQGAEYKGGQKPPYLSLRMLKALGEDLFIEPEIKDQFVGVIAARSKDSITIIFYNYIDPNAGENFISRNIWQMSEAERKMLLKLVKAEELDKVISRQIDISTLRLTLKLRALLKKAQELNARAEIYKSSPRNVALNIKGLSGGYIYERYVIDASTNKAVDFKPREEKEVLDSSEYKDSLQLAPYSVNMIVLKKKATQATP